ncbi:MAG: hypothetical protein R3C11_07405 [Planctomycetaceae bacterium]
MKEGLTRKFRQSVEQISFSGNYALERHQQVWYITERAIFELTPNGLELREIAPGIDLERDILGQMEFTPVIGEYGLMPDILFKAQSMNLD